MISQKTEDLLNVVVRGGIIIFVGSIIGKVLRFIFFICLTRVLGASLFGLYSIGQSIVDILTNIGLLGSGRGFVRLAVNYLNDDDAPRLKGLIQSYLGVCLLLSLLIAVSLFFGAEYISSQLFHNSTLTGVLRIFALSFPFYCFALIIVPIGYPFHRMEYKMIIQEICQPAINIIAIVIIFILGGKLYGAVAGFFVSSLITAILGFHLLKSLYPQVFSRSECIFETRKLIVNSLPILGIVFCYYLLFRLDRIMLGIYRTPFEVGIYSVASNTAIGIIALSGIFEACLSPVIAQLYHSRKNEELIKIYHCVTFWGAALTFIPCVMLIIFNKEILLLFGKDFTSAYLVLIIFSASCLIEVIPGQLSQLFQMSSHQNLEFINSIFMILINFIFNLILIPLFGVVGAASAFLFTMIIISIIRTIELKIIFNFLPFNPRYLKFLSYIFIAFIVGFSSLSSHNIIFKLSIVFSILASFIYFIIKFRSQEDVFIWDSLKSKLANYGFVNQFTS